MKIRVVALMVHAVALLPAPASAHHSFAMFDREEGKETTISGVVKDFSLINPHGWFKILVAEPDGRAAAWSFEMASVGQLQRLGWTRDTVKPGDKVTVTFYPLRVGSDGGEFISVVLPDGRTFKGLNEPDRGFPTQAGQ
jgi:hypothetical protein